MKLPVLSLTLVLALILGGCAQATPTPAVSESPQLPTVLPTTASQTLTESPTGITPAVLRNATYFAPYYQKTVTLVDGKYQSGSGADSLTVTLLPQIAFGDLNKDGTQDAAIMLAENGGGSGTFVSLLAVLDQNGGLVQVSNSIAVDDRPVIQDLVIQDGSILLTALIHTPNDPMTTPSLQTSLTYGLMDGTLWLARMTSTTQGGAEHSINITSSAFSADTPQHVEVKGNMPIAPFENTLGYYITDTAGNQLATGSLMVDAADMGSPATFDHTFDLTGIPSGTMVHLSIFEGDMSGFHLYNALDSAVFTVK